MNLSNESNLPCKLMTYKETSAYLGLALGTVYSLVCRKMIPHRRLTGRIVRFDPNDLNEWLKNSKVEDKRLSEDKETQ